MRGPFRLGVALAETVRAVPGLAGVDRVQVDLVQGLAMHLCGSADEAQHLLQGYDRSEHLDAVLEGRGEEIAVGIERAAAFLASSSRTGGQVRAIYTCGGGSRIPGLSDVLADRLRLSVQQANPLVNLKVRDGALNSLVTDEVAPLLMLPIGLALRQVA